MDAPTAASERLTTIAVATRLVERISVGDRPLGAIADALTELAGAVDASRVVVAVDDTQLGRQVFTSSRAPLGAEPIGLFGAPGTWTEPAGRLDHEEAELVAATVGVALHALPHDEPARGTDAVALSGPALTGPALTGPALAGAVARARDHGWTFALALVRFDDGDHTAGRAATLQRGLRPGDVAAPAGDALAADALAVMLPAARDEEAATILGTAVRAAGLPPCAFGLVTCPGDADEAGRLLALARQRLADTASARNPDSRHR